MAQGLGLGEAGQADRRPPLQAAEAGVEGFGLVEVDAGAVEAADLEEQGLDLGEGLVAGEGGVRSRAARGGAGDVPVGAAASSAMPAAGSATAARAEVGRP